MYNQSAQDKNSFDIVSITRPGKAKRSNYIQEADFISREKVHAPGKFIKVFADIFLKREAGHKSYF